MTTEAIELDTYRLAVGFGLMFCYTMFMLGKLNVVEHRTYLAMTGQVYTEHHHQLSELIQVWLVVNLILMGYYYNPTRGTMEIICLRDALSCLRDAVDRRPIEPILLQRIFNIFTFILGGQFLLPQRANNGKGGFIQLQN